MFEMGLIQTIVGGLITVSGGVLVAFLTHRWRSKAETVTLPPQTPLPAAVIPSPQLELPITVSPKKHPPNPSLTHKAIAEAIEAVPPFQQKGVEESFHGIRVAWQAKLFGISRHGGDELSVTIILGDSHRTMVFCRARLQDCEGLTHAPTGSPVLVTGDIKMISLYESELENCCIQAL